MGAREQFLERVIALRPGARSPPQPQPNFYTPPHLLMSTFFHSTTAVKSKRIKKLTWGKKGHLAGKAYLGEEHDNIIGIGKREETTVSDVVVADPVTANTQWRKIKQMQPV